MKTTYLLKRPEADAIRSLDQQSDESDDSQPYNDQIHAIIAEAFKRLVGLEPGMVIRVSWGQGQHRYIKEMQVMQFRAWCAADRIFIDFYGPRLGRTGRIGKAIRRLELDQGSMIERLLDDRTWQRMGVYRGAIAPQRSH